MTGLEPIRLSNGETADVDGLEISVESWGRPARGNAGYPRLSESGRHLGPSQGGKIVILDVTVVNRSGRFRAVPRPEDVDFARLERDARYEDVVYQGRQYPSYVRVLREELPDGYLSPGVGITGLAPYRELLDIDDETGEYVPTSTVTIYPPVRGSVRPLQWNIDGPSVSRDPVAIEIQRRYNGR